MISEELVFGSSDSFEVTACQCLEDQVILSVQSRKKYSTCPHCHINSHKLHSYYHRKIKDLPAFDNKVCLHLRARKWYCYNTHCKAKIFTETFEHYFKRYKRFSDRLQEKLLNIAILMGGNAGEKLCRAVKITASSSTLIRLIHSRQLPTPQPTNAVGIDDWAFKKGINYGTVIVDLNEHRVIDLLADRESHTVETWLKDRPEVNIVSRDRFSGYASAVTNALPDAVQVADRWHLLKNMGDALQKLLERKRQEIIAAQCVSDEQALSEDQIQTEQNDVADHLSRRHVQMQQVKKMRADGVAIKAIARTLGMNKKTVRKYIYLHEPPRKKGRITTNITHYNEYLQSRMHQDSQVETLQLFKEIKAMGYNGGRSALYVYVKPYVKQRERSQLVKLPKVSWIASQVKMLLCKKEEQLVAKDKELVHEICEKSQDIKEAWILATKFREMMENKQGHLLRDWIDKVLQSSLRELKDFAKGLMSDYKAVENALTLTWSNGQVEGQINKLKTIKRQMYGRAGFELLRKRVILSSAYYHQN